MQKRNWASNKTNGIACKSWSPISAIWRSNIHFGWISLEFHETFPSYISWILSSASQPVTWWQFTTNRSKLFDSVHSTSRLKLVQHLITKQYRDLSRQVEPSRSTIFLSVTLSNSLVLPGSNREPVSSLHLESQSKSECWSSQTFINGKYLWFCCVVKQCRSDHSLSLTRMKDEKQFDCFCNE